MTQIKATSSAFINAPFERIHKILAETDLNTGLVTTFTVQPAYGEQATSVTIATEYSKPGIMGFVERLTAPPLLRRIYTRELEKFAEFAKGAV